MRHIFRTAPGSPAADAVRPASISPAPPVVQVGDDVFAFPDFSMGCHAQYRTMPANGKIERLPAGMDFTQAATLCFGNCTALGFLRQLGKVSRC